MIQVRRETRLGAILWWKRRIDDHLPSKASDPETMCIDKHGGRAARLELETNNRSGMKSGRAGHGQWLPPEGRATMRDLVREVRLWRVPAIRGDCFETPSHRNCVGLHAV